MGDMMKRQCKRKQYKETDGRQTNCESGLANALLENSANNSQPCSSDVVEYHGYVPVMTAKQGMNKGML
jgi:hypothetical protein